MKVQEKRDWRPGRSFQWSRASVVLTGVVMAACSPAAEQADAGLAERAQTADGVAYTATTALLASYPVRMRATATATNESRRPVTVRFPDDCPALARILTIEGELRWDERALRSCSREPVEVTLAPGESASFETELSASEILGDSLPDAVYVVAMHLAPDGERPILLRAGRANLVVPR